MDVYKSVYIERIIKYTIGFMPGFNFVPPFDGGALSDIHMTYVQNNFEKKTCEPGLDIWLHSGINSVYINIILITVVG